MRDYSFPWCSKSDLNEEEFSRFHSTVKRGDIVGVKGFPGLWCYYNWVVTNTFWLIYIYIYIASPYCVDTVEFTEEITISLITQFSFSLSLSLSLFLSLSHLMFDNELKILWHKETIMESVGRTSKYKFKRDRLKIPLNRCFILVFFPMVNCFSFLCCIIGFFFFFFISIRRMIVEIF